MQIRFKLPLVMSLISAILSPLTAFATSDTVSPAISYGTDVSKADYQDWMVRILVKMSDNYYAQCGGALIGDGYLLTASHCMGDVDYSVSPRDYDWFIDQDPTNTITIIQSNNLNADDVSDHTYSGISYSIIELGKDTDAILSKFSDYYEAMLESGALGESRIGDEFSALPNINMFSSYINRDVVLVKLNESVPHKTQALMETLFDYQTKTHNVEFNSTFLVRGWGRTEDGNQSDVLQYTTEQYDLPYGNRTVFYELSDANNDGIYYDYESIACSKKSSSTCYANVADTFYLNANEETGALALPGDSGTAVTFNDKIYGVASSYSSISETNQFTYLDYYWDTLIDSINELIYPNNIEEVVGRGDSNTIRFSIPVQNMTKETIYLSPVMEESSDESIIPLSLSSDCNNQLESGQGCIITVIANENQQALTNDVTAHLNLNESNIETVSEANKFYGTSLPIIVTVNGSAADTDTDTDTNDNGNWIAANNNSSGGGSVNGIIIGFLMLTAFFRTWQRVKYKRRFNVEVK